MPFSPIKLLPGVDTVSTPLLNEAKWSQSQLIRFFQGKLQKLGGWIRLTSTALMGICRGIFGWADLVGNPYVACGTTSNLEVFYAGTLYDITPITKTDNILAPFSTSIGSNVVTIMDAAHGSNVGDVVNIYTISSVGGLILQGFYPVQSIIDANNYTINAASNATGNITNGGATAEFATTNTLNSVSVTLNNHGYTALVSVFTVHVSTTVGGIVFLGDYIVQSVTDANTFVITAAGLATSTATGYENSGNVQIQYLLPSGLASAVLAQGYGEGGYGLGGWGIGTSTNTYTPLRQWTMFSWGRDLIACPTNGAIYLWDPSGGEVNNPATLMSVNAPAYNTGIFLSMPYQQVVSFGAQDPNTGNQDPMLIRWCDISDFTDWTATVTNQAGSFRLPRGSRIIGAIQSPQFGMIWTDLGVWQMQYINFPLVYGFNEIASGCGLIAMRAWCVLGGAVYWMSYNQFFMFDGQSVRILPCPVWDILFTNINLAEQDKICFGADSHFDEFFVFYPSATGNGENDSYIKYNKTENAWDYGMLSRTAWVDQNIVVNNNPLGVDATGLIQQHEQTSDADGQPMASSATSGWFKLQQGEVFSFIERIIPDFIQNGTMILTIFTANYPSDTPTSFTFNTTNITEYSTVRLRGRVAKIQISSNDLGSFWRLGEILANIKPAGRM